MLLNIHHETTYRYETPVPYGLQQVRLVPKSRDFQKVHKWTLEIDGGKTEVEFEDHHANLVRLISFDEGARTVVVRSHGQVETTDVSGVIGKHGGYAPMWLFLRETPLTQAGTGVRELVREASAAGDTLGQMHALSAQVIGKIRYKTGTTVFSTTAEEAIVHGEGVCQDHAHVFIAAARKMGVPARYVSGYLMMNDRVIQDATHAWAEVFIEDLGWVGFDISNQYSPDARYVRIATGLDYRDAAPVSGVRFGVGSESLNVVVQVQQQ